jgi:hypothetical protein
MPASPWKVPEGPGWSVNLSGNNNANNNAIPLDQEHFGLYRQPDGTYIFSYRLRNPTNNVIIAGSDVITQMRFTYTTLVVEDEHSYDTEKTQTTFQYETITHPGLVQTFAFIRERNSEMELVNYKLAIRRTIPGASTTKVIHLDEEQYDSWWPVIAEQAPDGLIPDMLPPVNFPIPAVPIPAPVPLPVPVAPVPVAPAPVALPPPPPAPSANNAPNMPSPAPPNSNIRGGARRRNTRRRKARLGRKRQSRRRAQQRRR